MTRKGTRANGLGWEPSLNTTQRLRRSRRQRKPNARNLYPVPPAPGNSNSLDPTMRGCPCRCTLQGQCGCKPRSEFSVGRKRTHGKNASGLWWASGRLDFFFSRPQT